jgi:hypothetical protein
MAADMALDELARPQAGVVSRSQLLAGQWSSGAIERAIACGRLTRVARGVYRVSGAPWSRRAAQHAALLLVGPGATLARWSAAELHGFAEPRGGPLDLLAPHPRRQPADADELLRLRSTRDLPPVDRCEIDGLPVTSGARTLVDLAGLASTAQLAELAAAAVRVRACTLEQVRHARDARPSARGRARLTAALELLGDDGPNARSDVEIGAVRILVNAGLPRPVVAHRVIDGRGRFVAEVDLAYPDLRIAIEIDGFRWHSSPERKRRDEQRQNRLVLTGWTVLRFSASQVRHQPSTFVTAVRTALAAQ